MKQINKTNNFTLIFYGLKDSEYPIIENSKGVIIPLITPHIQNPGMVYLIYNLKD